MHRIIFIEGLPGAGKTTFVKRLDNYLSKNKIKSLSFKEGDLNPIDLAWIAILNQSEYDMILEEYPSLKKQIIKYTRKVEDKYYVAYINVKITEKEKSFHKTLKQFEIYRTNDLNYFLSEHLKLWEKFVEDISESNDVFLFESVFLQNHMNRLLLNQGFDLDNIFTYYNKLTKPIKKLKPLVFYIKQLNVKKTLKTMSDKRISPNKELYNDWIDDVIDYIKIKPIAKKRNYLDYDGVLQYFKDRQIAELRVLNDLDVDYLIIPLIDDYEEVFQKMTDYLNLNL
ncbi:MAG: hypothetical protein K9L64_00560 [Candidatus Izimaplasma sp.]|nr:hypothetical protein [Candidatus Izimaplasma bacterium]